MNVSTTMRLAFDNCKIVRNHPVDRLINAALQKNQGFDMAHKGRGWNAHLSHATYTELHNKGML